MADLPSFLRACDKFPVPPSHDIDHHYHRSTRRSFELVVSLEALLEIDEAAELLIGFVLLPVVRKIYDDLCHFEQYYTVIWLSSDIYISNYDGTWPVCFFLIHHADDHHPVARCGPKSSDTVYVCSMIQQQQQQQRHHHMDSPSFASSPDAGAGAGGSVDTRPHDVVDTLLRLLAKHKTISSIATNNIDFFASPDALQTFVREAKSPRTLSFWCELSCDQWRVIAFHCNKNVKLTIDSGAMKGWIPLMEAMNCSQCPTRLCFLDIQKLRRDSTEWWDIWDIHNLDGSTTFLEFVDALKSTTSLRDLEISGTTRTDYAILMALCEAIAENHGLQRLCLRSVTNQYIFSMEAWDIICRALASHPTLQKVDFSIGIDDSSRSPERDQLFIQYISSNSVLHEFTTSDHHCQNQHRHRNKDTFYDYDTVQLKIRPHLEKNRFRSLVVESIQKETNVMRRQQLFTTILLKSRPVFNCPACRFWLLKENSDLLTDDVLGVKVNVNVAAAVKQQYSMPIYEPPLAPPVPSIFDSIHPFCHCITTVITKCTRSWASSSS